MDWSEIETRLVAAVREAALAPDLEVRWSNDGTVQGWEALRHVRLEVLRIIDQAQGEPRWRAEGADGALRPSTYVPQGLILQVLVESQDQRLVGSAWALANTIRTGIRNPGARGILRRADLSLQAQGNLIATDYTDEHRRKRNVAIWELTLNASTLAQGALQQWMDQAVVEGAVRAEAGEGTTPVLLFGSSTQDVEPFFLEDPEIMVVE